MKIKQKYSISLLLLLLGFTGLRAQADASMQEAAKIIGNERYMLLTNRSIYTAGSTIHFHVVPLEAPYTPDGIKLSRVYYIDLLAMDGTRIASGRFPLGREGLSGSLVLPENLVSRACFLRGYTRWMTNFPEQEYHYTPLLLIDPDQPVPEYVFDFNGSFEQADRQIISPAHSDRTKYALRDRVTVRLPEIEGTLLGDQITVSVVRSEAYFPSASEIRLHGEPAGKVTATEIVLPESRGLSLSGKAENISEISGGERMIWLSLLGEEGVMLSTMVDSSGNFIFQLPALYGSRELHLMPEHPDMRLNINQNFSGAAHPAIHTFVTDSLGEEVIRFMEEESLYGQLEKIYSREELSSGSTGEEVSQSDFHVYPFYGNADYSYILDDFIELPSIRDYFRELINMVRIRQRDGITHATILNKNSNPLGERPLIMVDMIPVSMDQLLHIHPEQVSRIEIVNRQYLRGDAIFNGILCLYTNKGDYGDIEFSKNGKFFHINFYEELPAEIKIPDAVKDDVPDLRTTLYWRVMNVNELSGEQEFSFDCSDVPGNYSIILRSVRPDGTVLRGISKFLVE